MGTRATGAQFSGRPVWSNALLAILDAICAAKFCGHRPILIASQDLAESHPPPPFATPAVCGVGYVVARGRLPEEFATSRALTRGRMNRPGWREQIQSCTVKGSLCRPGWIWTSLSLHRERISCQPVIVGRGHCATNSWDHAVWAGSRSLRYGLFAIPPVSGHAKRFKDFGGGAALYASGVGPLSRE